MRGNWLQVPQRYKPPAQDIIEVAMPAQQPALALQPPFRPVDFKWAVAKLALGMLGALGRSGLTGAAWAAKGGNAVAAVISRSPVLQLVLG